MLVDDQLKVSDQVPKGFQIKHVKAVMLLADNKVRVILSAAFVHFAITTTEDFQLVDAPNCDSSALSGVGLTGVGWKRGRIIIFRAIVENAVSFALRHCSFIALWIDYCHFPA